MSRPYAQVLKRYGEQKADEAGREPAETMPERHEEESSATALLLTDSLESAGRSDDSSESESVALELGTTGEVARQPGRELGVDMAPFAQPESLIAARGPAQAQVTRSGLLDTLRMISPRREAPCVVLAGATGVESVRQLTRGLLRQARATGVAVLLAEADSGAAGPSLCVVDNSSDEAVPQFESGSTIEWDDSGKSSLARSRRLDSWLDEASASHDLVVIEGPSLDRTLEAALLGSRCDGLVIVAEVERTHRDKLSISAERVIASGCVVHGLVLDGTRRWLPRWLDRILEEMVS